MATDGAHKRLTREYATIQKNPPPYITAHPSEANILEWHYILTGPPETPYEDGQYWGILKFPANYPFAPPAILMHTPSGRFQPSTRLCLSISDFHPRAFNPTWEVSTILIGLLSFMTSDEMTTGSIGASDTERKWHAARSRWWNATGGGSVAKTGRVRGLGNIKAGDGGAKFRREWPDLEQDNWAWMKKHEIDPNTGKPRPLLDASSQCSPETAALRRTLGGSASGVGGLMHGGQAARDAGQGWMSQHKLWIAVGAVFIWVLIARILGDPE